MDRGRGRGGRGGGRGGPRGGGRGGRGGSRGGFRGGRGGRGGMRGGSKVVISPHRHPNVFIASGKGEDALVPGATVYGIWNPYRSKLAAAILGGVSSIWMAPSSSILYLGAASGTTVSHCSDIVGQEGIVYAVEFSERSGRDLVTLCKTRTNIVPIIEDARYPLRYRMIVGMVDTIFSDVAQPDQVRIVALNAQYFLKSEGHVIISIKANCIDSTAAPAAVFASVVEELKKLKFKPRELITLERYERNHAVVIATFRPSKREKREK